MKTINELEAKRIVRKGLDSWCGTLNDFHELTSAMLVAAKGVNSLEKREILSGNI